MCGIAGFLERGPRVDQCAVISRMASSLRRLGPDDEGLYCDEHIALRADLESLGHRFRTASDSEVIVHAYEAWGPAIGGGCAGRSGVRSRSDSHLAASPGAGCSIPPRWSGW